EAGTAGPATAGVAAARIVASVSTGATVSTGTPVAARTCVRAVSSVRLTTCVRATCGTVTARGTGSSVGRRARRVRGELLAGDEEAIVLDPGRAVVVETHDRTVVDPRDDVLALSELRRIDRRRAVRARLELLDGLAEAAVFDGADPVTRVRRALCEVQPCALIVFVAGGESAVGVHCRDVAGGVRQHAIVRHRFVLFGVERGVEPGGLSVAAGFVIRNRHERLA